MDYEVENHSLGIKHRPSPINSSNLRTHRGKLHSNYLVEKNEQDVCNKAALELKKLLNLLF